MASDEKSNHAASESAEADEQKHAEETETLTGESESEDIEQLRAERDQYKRDYAALKKDYDEKAHAAKAQPKKSGPAPDEDLTDWKILHSDDIRLAGKEYQDEVSFLKSQGVKMTVEVLERALGNAKARKGLGKKEEDPEAKRQAETAGADAQETRNGKPKIQMPERLRKMGMTEERFLEIHRQKEEERKALGK